MNVVGAKIKVIEMVKPPVNYEFLRKYLSNIIKPGAVIVSDGMRGGGKTHTAVSFCQNIIEGKIGGFPEHTILLTNVIFVRKNRGGGFDTGAPPNVHTVFTLKEIFPIIADNLEMNGRKDTMFILLLDEAQNFLMGDMNSSGEMAKSMKSFCGIIRKFNLCLWLISPALRNLGPAFRNFIDADNDPANVTCTFEKHPSYAKRLIEERHYDMDPRSLVEVKPGAKEFGQMLPVLDASWTKDPESLKEGEYAYDHLASADFRIGEGFPFDEFVFSISGKSSYHMIESIREFYQRLDSDQSELPLVSEETRNLIETNYRNRIVWEMYCQKFTHKQIASVFGVSERSSQKWISQIKESKSINQPKEGG